MIEKIRVPKEVYLQLIALNREIHDTFDFPWIVQMAQNRGYLKAAAWLRENEDAYKRGFTRGFKPE
jgi:hypothetical protein